jgi:hypothetical protein
MSALAQRYRVVLHAYPRSYRARRGDELLGTLMDDAQPEQRWPSAHEVASIVVEGVRERLDASRRRLPRAVWLDGLHVALVLLLAHAFAEVVGNVVWRVSAPAGLTMLLLALLSIVAVLRGRWVVALPLTTAWLAVQVYSSAVSWQYPLTAVLVLAFLAVWHRRMRQVRSAWWLLAVPVMIAVLDGPQLLAGGPVYLFPYLQVTMAVAAVAGAAAALLDPRVPIVVACVLAAETLQVTMTGPQFSDSDSSGIFLVLAHQTLQATVPLRTSGAPAWGIQMVVAPSWWTLVLIAAAALLFLLGHLRLRERTLL